MSIHVMTLVWGSDLPAEQKYVLLALADHAHDDGSEVRPSVPTVAHKTSLSERTVQRRIRELRDAGFLELTKKASRYSPNVYRIRGDRLTPLDLPGVTAVTARGDSGDVSGVTPVSPESSLEPSLNQPQAPSAQEGVDKSESNGQGRARRTALKDAIVRACWGGNPREGEFPLLTRSAWGRVEKAAKELDDAERATDTDELVEDIASFGTFWRQKYEHTDLTPQAITNNWPSFRSGSLMDVPRKVQGRRR